MRGINRFINVMIFLCMAVLIFMAVASVGLCEPFYKESDMPGYWWGKDPKEEPKPEEEEKRPEKKGSRKPEKKEPRYPKMTDFSTKEIYDMYPDQFTELMDDFKKQAVQKPTVENVEAYLKMQDIAIRKAVTFDNVARLAMQQNPALSLENDFQVSGPGKEAANTVEKNEYDQMLITARNDFGLIYFYQDGCPYCDAENKVLDFLRGRGWEIKPINMKRDPGTAARFNITVAPSLILVKRGEKQHIPISYGVVTFIELRERIYNGVRLLNGDVTPEQFGMRESERGGGFDTMAPLAK